MVFVILGLLLALLVQAPAVWLLQGLSTITGARWVALDAQGTVWRGSARWALTPGPARAGTEAGPGLALPGRVHWQLRPAWPGVLAIRIADRIGKGLRSSPRDALLAASATPAARAKLAEATGISAAQVLKFANMADLYRISGVGSDYAQLLEAAGVDTVPALARRAPANLAATLAEVNAEKKLTRRVPPEADVAKWVAQAKELPRVLEY